MPTNSREGLRHRPSPEDSKARQSETRNQTSIHRQKFANVQSNVAYTAISLGLLLLKLSYTLNNYLPSQVKIEDEKYQPDRFVGERAENVVKSLTDIGTKVVGSYENEVLAVDLLHREISYIQQQAGPLHQIVFDIQKPVGSYYLAFKPYGFRNYYANIQNLVVRMSSGNHSTHSVLLNCHYDTVPESPGASDNGLNCAVMLEVMRKLSKQTTPLKNNVIFLFNGAEENPLQAAHGFITQHPWSKEVRVVINLDSGGAGGKEMLFQTSSAYPWLAEVYASSVPHPSGTVAGEDIFQSGIMPSDTDFRVFRDFGHVPGLDLAHGDNGYIYHTRLDKMEYIAPGVYQHTGDNILALTKALVASPHLASTKGGERYEAGSRVIYFDIFGLFMVVYTEKFALALNLGTALLSLLSIFRAFTFLPDSLKSVKGVIKSAVVVVCGWNLAVALLYLLAKTMELLGATLSWYARPIYIVPLYLLPLLYTTGLLPVLLLLKFRGRETNGQMAIFYVNGVQLVWTGILLLGTYMGFRATYTVMLLVLFPSLASLALTQSRDMFSVKKFIIGHLVSTVLPIFYLMGQATRIFTILIPMAARMGPQVNPDMVIALLTIMSGILITSYAMPLLVVVDKPLNVLATLCAFHILTMVAVIGTPLGFPYSGSLEEPALQRFYVLHTERTFHDEHGRVRRSDSGFFVQPMDHNNIQYVAHLVPSLRSTVAAAIDCQTELYCGVPVFTSRFISPAPFAHWVPVQQPVVHHPTSLEVLSRNQVSVKTRRVRLQVTGPDHISIVICPRAGVNLLAWSFDEFQPDAGPVWQGRSTYMVYYSHGLVGGTLEFHLDLEITTELTDSAAVADVAVVGHYMHDKKFRTSEFNQFLAQFPDWAHVTPWTATYKSWVV